MKMTDEDRIRQYYTQAYGPGPREDQYDVARAFRRPNVAALQRGGGPIVNMGLDALKELVSDQREVTESLEEVKSLFQRGESARASRIIDDEIKRSNKRKAEIIDTLIAILARSYARENELRRLVLTLESGKKHVEASPTPPASKIIMPDMTVTPVPPQSSVVKVTPLSPRSSARAAPSAQPSSVVRVTPLSPRSRTTEESLTISPPSAQSSSVVKVVPLSPRSTTTGTSSLPQPTFLSASNPALQTSPIVRTTTLSPRRPLTNTPVSVPTLPPTGSF